MEYGYDICWDEAAFRAMRKVFNYLKKNISEEIALKFKADVFAAAEKILKQPELYSYDRLLLEKPPRYRSIPVGGYRLVYEFKNDNIFILFIYHTRQDPKKVRKDMP